MSVCAAVLALEECLMRDLQNGKGECNVNKKIPQLPNSATAADNLRSCLEAFRSRVHRITFNAALQ